MKKKLLYFFFLILILVLLCQSAFAFECSVIEGSNASAQNYTVWTKPIKSNLILADNGQYMRVQYVPSYGSVLIEYYDKSFNFISSKELDSELNIFGGFFSCDNGYYIVTGKRNSKQSDSAEVIRITKYDKSWKRLTSVSLYGKNTIEPFDTGAVRFAKSGKYIMIRTCHEMYRSSVDDRGNFTIQLDSENMTVTDCQFEASTVNYGYVRHSANQFILVDSDSVVALDHGDGSPRSIALIKYKTKVSSGKFTPRYNKPCTCIDMFAIAGEKGDNYTNCSVGGFEMSQSAYIAAICSIDQSTGSKAKNIYVSSLNKSSDKAVVTKLTSYSDNNESCTTPHLVKTDSNAFVIMWQKGQNVCFAELDGSGSLKGKIHSFKGELSDCVPIKADGKLIWYVWNNDIIDFYEINLNDLSSNKTSVSTDHDYRFYSASGSTVTLLCAKCSKTSSATLPTDFKLLWQKRDSKDAYVYMPDALYHPKESISLKVTHTQSVWGDYEVISSNESVVKISRDPSGALSAQMLTHGEATVTVRSKYNPQIKMDYTVKVSHTWSETESSPTCTQDGSITKACDVCGEKSVETTKALGHDYSTYTITKEPTCTAQGKKTATCSRCGETTSENLPRKDHDKNITIPQSDATCEKSGKTQGKKCSMCGAVTVQQETIAALGHDYGAYVTTKEPTCTAQGKKTATCSRCGETTSENLPRKDHDKNITIPQSDATCDKSGKTQGKKCSMCGAVTVQQETIAALGHDYGEYVTTKEPTCTAQGKKTATCSRCGETTSENLPRKDHDKNITIPQSDATCEKSGKTQGKKCSMCGAVTVQQETIAALGHDYGAYVTTKEPTCKAQGKKTATCSRCNETTSENLPRKDHDKNITIPQSDATCDKSGKTQGKKCSMCGAVTVQQETIAALGHDYGAYVTTKEPTCTAQGKKTATCSRCNETTSENLLRKDHDKNITIPQSDATCEKSGKTQGKKCSMCGAVTVQQETIAALGHDYGEYATTKEPTCTAQGKKTATCSRCGETTSKSIAKIAHDEKTVVKETKATCDKSGKTQGKKCSMCGTVTVEQEIIAALGHDYGEYATTKEPSCTAQGKKIATCSRCGETTSKNIAKIAHDEKTTVKGTSATCDKTGKTQGKKCSMCGTVTVEQEVIAALGHDYGEYVTTKEPTCTAQGTKTASCTRCKKEKSQSIEKLGHDYKEYEVIKEPTCTAKGTKAAYCLRCNQRVTDDIAKLPHEKTVIKATKATCTKGGKTQGAKCKACGKVLEEQKSTEKLGHSYKVTVITKATVENHGKVKKKCQRCGAESTQKVYMIKTVKLTQTKYAYTGKAPKLKVSVIDSQKNALKQGEDYSVSVGSAKKIGTYTATITFKGKYSGSKKLSFSIITGKTSKISGSATTSQIKLTWSVVAGATGYRVYQYDTANKKYKLLATVSKNTYTVKKLKSGTKYKFAVKAYTKLSDSGISWGSSVSAQLATKPAKPELTAKCAKGEVSLSWKKVSGATGYQVYYSTSKDGEYKRLKATTALSYKNTALKKGKTYYFKVRAYTKAENGISYGAFSNIKSVKVK